MQKSWFYRSQGRIAGPLEFEGLTQLAATGTLQPTDELRRGDTGEWMPAGSVVGLFPEPEELQDLADLNYQFVETLSPSPSIADSQPADSMATLDDLNIQIVSEAESPKRSESVGNVGRTAAIAVDEPPADGWFYRSLGQELGPMPFDEILKLARNGVLARNDGVRHGVSGAWQRAARFSELIDEFPPEPVAPPAEVNRAEGAKSAGKRKARRKKRNIPAEPPDNGEPRDAPAVADDLDPDLPPPPPVQPAPVDRWFCQIDDVEHGPLTHDELAAMAKHGRIKPETRTKRGDDGDWKVAATIDGLFPEVPAAVPAGFAAASPAGSMPSKYVAPKVKKEKKPREKRVRGPSEPFMPRIANFFAKNKPIVFGALGLAVIAAVVTFFVAGRSGSEAEYVKRLREILDEHNALKQRNAADGDWQPLRDKAKALSAEILPVLTKTANSKHPERQELLWATQDMIGMLSKGPKTPNPDEKHFVNHLKAAAEILKLDGNISAVPSGGKPDSKSAK